MQPWRAGGPRSLRQKLKIAGSMRSVRRADRGALFRECNCFRVPLGAVGALEQSATGQRPVLSKIAFRRST